MNHNPQLEIMKSHILQAAYAKRLLTLKQYQEKYKGKYIDQYGCDSFITLLSYLVETYGEDGNVFVTLCKPMLKDRKKFKEIFDIEIVSPEDLHEKLHKGEKKK